MHNCREIRERLTEFVLDGIDARSDTVVATELNNCAECRSEFDSLNATLRLTARLSESAVPAKSYWNGYHERLRKRLDAANCAQLSPAAAQRRSGLAPFFASLRRCVRKTVPVPIPLGISAVVLLAALALVAARPVRQPPSSPIIVQVPVEVPVVQEKIVTQVVYRDRRSPSRISKPTSTTPTVESTFARFKPTDDVKLTVIKGGFPNEK